MTIEGPDFICVGLAKAGTGWLYDQAAWHPDFWMPPYKELRYFDQPFPSSRMRDDLLIMRRRIRTGKAPTKKSTDVPLDGRDAAFIDRALALAGAAKDLDAYATLFAPKGDRLSGDVSPNYAYLAEDLVRAIAARFDRTKVVLLLRDPVERAWSHWRMRNRVRTKSQLEDIEAFRRFLDDGKIAERWTPTVAAKLWGDSFGDRFRYFFLDDISRTPEAARAEILSFIGADPAKASPLPADHNRKERPALARPPEVQALLRKAFAEERRRCAETFGGAALSWVDAPY